MIISSGYVLLCRETVMEYFMTPQRQESLKHPSGNPMTILSWIYNEFKGKVLLLYWLALWRCRDTSVTRNSYK